MRMPLGVKTHPVALKFDEPNDVGAGQLLRYEFHQRCVVKRLLRAKPFDVVHRATPSGYKDSLLRVPSVPLLVGPVLGSNPPPESFRSIYWPRVPDVHSWEWQRGRIEEAVARRVFPAAALRLTEAVTFVDGVPREALADLYRAADVYSIPTIAAYGIAL